MDDNILRDSRQSPSDHFGHHGRIIPSFSVAKIAETVGIDWHATSKNIDLRDGAKATGRWCVPLDPRDRGKVSAFVHEDGRGVRIVFHTFAHGGASATWTSDGAERETLAGTADRLQRELDARERQDKAGSIAAAIRQFHARPELTTDSPAAAYLHRKGVAGIIGRIDVRAASEDGRHWLEMAVRDAETGAVVGIQRISNDDKKFAFGSQTAGAFATIRATDNDGMTLTAEGLATAASAALATGAAVHVAGCAGNLHATARAAKRRDPDATHIILADNDRWKPESGNPGLRHAFEAAARIGGVRVAYPVFADDAQGQPTDFNDLHRLAGPDAVTARIAAAEKPPARPFDLALLLLSLAGKREAEKYAGRAIHRLVETATVPLETDAETAAERIAAAYPLLPEADRPRKARELAARIEKQVRRRTAEMLRPVHGASRPDIIEIPTAARDMGALLERVRQVHGDRFILLVRAPMGSGKTENVLVPFIAQARAEGRHPLAVCHRRSLTAQLAARAGIKEYRDMAPGEADTVSALAVCLNSIINPLFAGIVDRTRAVAVDEASQTLRALATGTVDRRAAVAERLEQVLRDAGQVVLLDAGIDQITLDYAAKVAAGRPVILATVKPEPLDVTLHVATREGGRNEVVGRIHAELAAGGKVIVATDSAAEAERVAASIASRHPDAATLLITSEDTGEPAVRAFLERPDEEAPKYRAIVYSPAISSGVSITAPGFAAFGMFFGIIPPMEVLQQVRRYRPAKDVFISIEPETGERETRPAELARAALDASRVQYENSKLVQHLLPIDRLRVKVQADENAQRNRYALALLAFAEAEGLRVCSMDATEARGHGGAARKEAAAQVKAERVARVLAAPDIDDTEAERVRRAAGRTRAESASLHRHDLRDGLGIAEPTAIDAGDVEFYDDGRGARMVKSYLEVALLDDAEAAAIDDAQADRPVTMRRNVQTRRMVFAALAEALGIDLTTGAGEWDAKAAQAAIDALHPHRRAMLAIGLTLPEREVRYPVRWVNDALGRLGLDVRDSQPRAGTHDPLSIKKTDPMCASRPRPARMYSITQESLARVKKYAEQRYNMKRTAPPELAGELAALAGLDVGAMLAGDFDETRWPQIWAALTTLAERSPNRAAELGARIDAAFCDRQRKGAP
ncbi:MAG: hypothetical protein E6R10_07215 [Rhodocyclaceae bacterium]|nr:MAG: hypothetical protein E6R10_07215 [Rhodocyclaceae bacterium]